jgi:CheY-like chemotaxis protein
MTMAVVVYVEDNADNFRLVQRLLEQDGEIEVFGAPDGPSGLALVQERRPALVLLDLDVPLLDGLEVARRLRADPATREIPIIAVSAKVMDGERQSCLDAGCAAYVEKPIEIIAFRELVRRILRGSAL